MEQTEKEKLDFIKSEIRKGIVKTAFPIETPGGQSCGMPIRGVTLTHYDMGFSISVSYHRSQIKNIDTALLLFDLFLDDVVY